jgi:hypothetical protein
MQQPEATPQVPFYQDDRALKARHVGRYIALSALKDPVTGSVPGGVAPGSYISTPLALRLIVKPELEVVVIRCVAQENDAAVEPNLQRRTIIRGR